MVYATITNYLKCVASRCEQSCLVEIDPTSRQEQSDLQQQYLDFTERRIVELLQILPEEIKLWEENDPKNIYLLLTKLDTKELVEARKIVFINNNSPEDNFSQLIKLVEKLNSTGSAFSPFILKLIHEKGQKECKGIISSMSKEAVRKSVIYMTEREINIYWNINKALLNKGIELQKLRTQKKIAKDVQRSSIKSKIKTIQDEITELERNRSNFESKSKKDKRKTLGRLLYDSWRSKSNQKACTITFDDLTDFPRLLQCFKRPNTFSDKDLESIATFKQHRFRTLFFNSVESALIKHEIFYGTTAVSVLNGIDAILHKLIQIKDLNMERLIAFLLKTSDPQIDLKIFIRDNADLDQLPDRHRVLTILSKAFGCKLKGILIRIKTINDKTKYKWKQTTNFLWDFLMVYDLLDVETQTLKTEADDFLEDDTILKEFQRRIHHILDDGRYKIYPLNRKIYYDRRHQNAVICTMDDNGNTNVLHYRRVWQKGIPQADQIMKNRELDMSKNVSQMYADLRGYGETFMKSGLELTSFPLSTHPVRSRCVNKRLGEKLRKLVLHCSRVHGDALTFKSVDKFVHHVAKHPQSKIYPNFNPKSLFKTFCKKGAEWILSAPTVNFVVKAYGIIVYFHNGSGFRELFMKSRCSQRGKRKRKRTRRARDMDTLPYETEKNKNKDELMKTPIKKLAILVSKEGTMSVNTFF